MNTDEQRSTIDVGGYDLDTPENCAAPSAISKYQADFLKALAKTTPEVLQTLREDVLPVVAGLSVFDRPDAQRGETELTRDQHIASWGKQFNLNDPWLHEAAKLTLRLWQNDTLAADDLHWAGLPDTPSQILPIAEREMKFEGPTWCVETEDWAQFKKRAKNHFNEALKAYKADLGAQLKKMTFRPALKLKKTDHFVWLALYQVRGSSPSQIATHILQERQKDVSESGVLKAVRKKAELIGLTLRPHNRGKGSKSRIVVRDCPRKFGRLPISTTGLRKRPALSP